MHLFGQAFFLYQDPRCDDNAPELWVVLIPFPGVFIACAAYRSGGEPLLHFRGVVERHTMRHGYQIKTCVYAYNHTTCKVFFELFPIEYSSLLIYFFADVFW